MEKVIKKTPTTSKHTVNASPPPFGTEARRDPETIGKSDKKTPKFLPKYLPESGKKHQNSFQNASLGAPRTLSEAKPPFLPLFGILFVDFRTPRAPQNDPKILKNRFKKRVNFRMDFKACFSTPRPSKSMEKYTKIHPKTDPDRKTRFPENH